MKKFLKGFLCAALCGAAIFATAACGSGAKKDTATFDFAGSLQTLYGADGYPQAVLVAKSEVIESDPAAVHAMLGYMAGAESYLAGAEPSTIVSDLAGAYPADLKPSFNAQNLNAQVVENCSVKFETATAAKESVKGYLAEVGFPVPADVFFYAGDAQEGEIAGNYTVYAPDGAPALALANAIDKADGHFTFHIVKADTIPAQVSNADMTKNADFCVLPSNAAAQKLGSGDGYKMLGVVTHGNMYFLRSDTGLPTLTAENLNTLAGKKVGVVQLNNVPGLTFQAVLKKANVPFAVLNSEGTPAEDKVNLVAFADASTVGPGAGCDYYLCPEPAASLKVNNFKAQNSK